MNLLLVLALIMDPTFATREPINQPEPEPIVVKVVREPEGQGRVTSGTASYYPGSRGFHGRPHVAVQDGRWTGKIQRFIKVCVKGHGCAILPVVDYCQCHRGEEGEKIVDLSIEAVRKFHLDTTDGIWNATIQEVAS